MVRPETEDQYQWSSITAKGIRERVWNRVMQQQRGEQGHQPALQPGIQPTSLWH